MLIQEDVRKHTASLLNTPATGKLEKKVSQDEADAYDPIRHECPFTANDFKLHLARTPAHSWNKAATKVFVRSFCKKYPHYTPGGAGRHFKVHLDSLIRKYRKQQVTRDDLAAEQQSKKQNRKNARKSSVSSPIRPTPSLTGHSSLRTAK